MLQAATMSSTAPLSTLPAEEDGSTATTSHRIKCPCTTNKKKRKYKKHILMLLRSRRKRCSKHNHKLLAVAAEETETDACSVTLNNNHHEHDSDGDSVSLCSCVHALEEEEEEGPSLPATPSILRYKTQQESRSQSYYTPLTTPDQLDCCHCALASAAAPSKKTGVSFSTVTIQSYNTVLSENPCPLEGPAVELGWEKVDPPVQLSVDLHFRFTNPWKQAHAQNLHLSGSTRRHRLLQAGFTHPQLSKAQKEASKVRSSRQKNASGCPQWLMHIFGWTTDDSCPACSTTATAAPGGAVRVVQQQQPTGQVCHPNKTKRYRQQKLWSP